MAILRDHPYEGSNYLVDRPVGLLAAGTRGTVERRPQHHRNAARRGAFAGVELAVPERVPVNYRVTPLDASSSDVAVEELILTFDSMDIE
jgi:hypothetical protein